MSAAAFVCSAAEAPAAPGAYVLLVDLARPVVVRFGARTAGRLAPGRYLYCGSAHGPGGLRARLARHLRRDKPVRWHVDQLTTRGTVRGAWIVADGDECDLVARLAHLPAPIDGFGASDCRCCTSHLLHWGDGAEMPFLVR